MVQPLSGPVPTPPVSPPVRPVPTAAVSAVPPAVSDPVPAPVVLPSQTARLAEVTTRFRLDLETARAELVIQRRGLDLLLREAPSLQASRTRTSERQTLQAGASVVTTPAAADDPSAAVTTSVGFSTTRRRDIASVVSEQLPAYQAQVVLRALDVRLAGLETVRAQTMLDTLAGRIAGADVRRVLSERLTREAQRANDMVVAILAPLGVFHAGARDLLRRLSEDTAGDVDRLVQRAHAQLTAAGLPPAPADPQAPGTTGTVTTAFFAVHQREERSLSMAHPGELTQALLSWQEHGIVGPGEMGLVVDRITNGVEAPRLAGACPATTSERLAQWAYDRRAVLFTPSLVQRLTAAIESEPGLLVDGRSVRTGDLPAYLRDERSLVPLLRAIGIDTRYLVPVTVTVTRSQSQTQVSGVAGALRTGPDGVSDMAAVVPGAAITALHRWSVPLTVEREILIDAGMRTVERARTSRRSEFGVGAEFHAAGPEYQGQVTAQFQF